LSTPQHLSPSSRRNPTHAVQEAVAIGEMLIAYVKGEEKLADVLTKVLPDGKKRDYTNQAML
jgi:hypothetical protein